MSSPRVLIVDDSKVSRMMSAGLIKQLVPHVQILEAENGDRALALAREQQPDVAILDMNMPGMSGIELSEHLRGSYPQLPMALLTANVQAAVIHKAEAQGLKFFRKPINEGVIREILAVLGVAL